MGRGCLSQLLMQHDAILTMMEEGMNVDLVLLDFAKAFNKMVPDILLSKVKKLHITDSWAGDWLHFCKPGCKQ